MSIILENKVISKLILSKNVNNKNVLINSYSTMKKRNQKDSEKFDVEILILALFDTSPLHKFAKFNDFIWLQLIFNRKHF